jgi:hypothetical protein
MLVERERRTNGTQAISIAYIFRRIRHAPDNYGRDANARFLVFGEIIISRNLKKKAGLTLPLLCQNYLAPCVLNGKKGESAERLNG